MKNTTCNRLYGTVGRFRRKALRYGRSGTLLLIVLTAAVSLLPSCHKLEGEYNDGLYNYDILWRTLDQRYCFFSYKGIDWDSLYDVHLAQLKRCRTSDEIFKTYCDLMANLHDGHVNLYAAGDMGRYWKWYTDYPRNFSPEVVERYYLGDGYRIAAGLSYTILRPESDRKIGYIRYESFSDGFGEGNLISLFKYLEPCYGLIIDVRDNGGGNLDYAASLAGHFADETTHYGYIRHKTGPGHDDFSTPAPRYIEPSEHIRWLKPVVVLTNRHCYSATNTFVCMMRQLPNVTILGDSTGGGGGLPFNAELPCGWTFRFSAAPMLDADGKQIENGIAPDIFCEMDTVALRNGIDSMIETATDRLQAAQ
mgnify:FL=1